MIAILIILGLLIIAGLIMVTIEDDDVQKASSIFGVILLFIVFSVCIYLYAEKKGQIDALSGKVKYKLVENPDKTREWLPK